MRRPLKRILDAKNLDTRRNLGQATTEYVILLATAITLALLVLNKLLRPSIDLLQEKLSDKVEQQLSDGVYHFNLGG